MKKISIQKSNFKSGSNFGNRFKNQRRDNVGFSFNKKGYNKVKLSKISEKISITTKTFRVFDSIINRRSKILRRLNRLNLETYSLIMLKYGSFRWLKDSKLVWGINKYKKEVESLESQGLKRKVVRRRLKIYGIALLDKQKIKNYYFGLKEYMLKNIVKEVFSSKINYLMTFVDLLESRLLSFIYRTNLFRSINQLRIFVKMGYILVNGTVIKNSNYRLSIGDKISLNYIPKNKEIYQNNIKKRFSLFYYASKYTEISFPMMIFSYYKRPRVEDVPYPFMVSLSRILYYYNYRGLR